MKILYSDQEQFTGGLSIFLAGPTPRKPEVPSWRPQAIEWLEKWDFTGTVLIPERQSGWAKANYEDQADWERAGLALCTKIAFWVPREMVTMPALTTNVEFGYWLAKTPERIIYGRPDDAFATKYLDWLYLHDNPNGAIFSTLFDVMLVAHSKAMVSHNNEPGI